MTGLVRGHSDYIRAMQGLYGASYAPETSFDMTIQPQYNPYTIPA